MRRIGLLVALAALLTGVVVWKAEFFGAAKVRPPEERAASSDAIGKPLYAPGTAPSAMPAARPSANAGPIVLPDCRLAVVEKQDVPSQRDGVLLFIGTDIEANQQVPAEHSVSVRIGGQERRFRRLKEGDVVRAGQLVAFLDDQLSRDDWAIKQARLAAARADLESALKASEEAKSRYETQRWLRQEGRATSDEELRTAKLNWDKASFEALAKREAVVLAERELNQADTVLRMHHIRSSVTGVIKTIYKRPGEAVHVYDPVVQVQQLTRLRVEGLVDVHQLPRLRPGMKAIVEAAQPDGAQQTLVGHREEITSVAVAQDGRILSASVDGTVRVWDRQTGKQLRVLSHAAAVRAVACAPTVPLCLTATADGTLHLWDLDATHNEPSRELAGKHEGAVTCVAFSPDGKVCATGGEDREIRLWDVASGALRYRFPAGHKAALTSIAFTPTCQLVSAGRDNTLRLWTVGEDAARLERTFDRRSGEVADLGVSPDGARVLYDQGSTLHVLALPTGLTDGVLQNPSATSFTTFARYAPDGRLVLAASAGGRVHLWRAPTGTNRAAELRQLVAPEAASATCAAFAPDGSFVVAGGRDRCVRLWPVPPTEELDKPMLAEITLVDRAMESSTQEARVWAELSNPDGRLLPGGTVTMVVVTEPGR